MTRQTKIRIAARKFTGESVRVLAKEYSVSASTIYRICAEVWGR